MFSMLLPGRKLSPPDIEPDKCHPIYDGEFRRQHPGTTDVIMTRRFYSGLHRHFESLFAAPNTDLSKEEQYSGTANPDCF